MEQIIFIVPATLQHRLEVKDHGEWHEENQECTQRPRCRPENRSKTDIKEIFEVLGWYELSWL
jgi:hypothetical protein